MQVPDGRCESETKKTRLEGTFPYHASTFRIIANPLGAFPYRPQIPIFNQILVYLRGRDEQLERLIFPNDRVVVFTDEVLNEFYLLVLVETVFYSL